MLRGMQLLTQGRLRPLGWLVIYPDVEGLPLLAQRLVKMGEDMGRSFPAIWKEIECRSPKNQGKT